MKLEERSALDWRFTDRNPHDNRADRAAAESSRRTACKGQGQDRPCRARPADRSLVAEDRSAGGVRDPTGPEELPRVLPGSCPRDGGHRGRASPSGRGGANGATVCEGYPRWPCHKRAIHSGPCRSTADNHGQPRSSLDLRRSPPSQVTAAAELALGAGGQSACTVARSVVRR
jgi:hypothetical protein